MNRRREMANETDERLEGYIWLPSASGGGAIVRRSQVAGARSNSQEGSIVYLMAGPSVYTTATIPQLGKYLSAEPLQVRE
jgi:hypothetical protein